GLTGSYYDDPAQTRQIPPPGVRPAMVRRDAQVAFDWAGGSPVPASMPAMGSDNFEVRWTGFVTVPQTGQYYFGAARDDGVRITVNGTLLLDSWVDQASPLSYGASAIQLQAGVPVLIQVDYYEHTGNANILLY